MKTQKENSGAVITVDGGDKAPAEFLSGYFGQAPEADPEGCEPEETVIIDDKNADSG
jgi:hypothetical protein